MEASPTTIPDVLLIRAGRREDTRGWFQETWRADRFATLGIATPFVQDNQSFSTERGTVRGLHFQRAPHAQAKLVRVITGRIFDVALDLRRSSATFGRHTAIDLGPQEGLALYIPAGFAHGFCALAPATLVSYKVSGLHAPQAEAGVLWNDPALGIAWPIAEAQAILSDRDRRLPPLAALAPPFD